jgi:glyoxylase I family protein
MIGTADHHGIVVSNADRATAFYRDVLGMTVTDTISQSDSGFSAAVGLDDTEVELVFLDADGFTVELVEYRTPEGDDANAKTDPNDVGAAHLCLAVEDADAAYRELKGQAEFVSPPQELENGVKLAFLTDPDGNYVELLEE